MGLRTFVVGLLLGAFCCGSVFSEDDSAIAEVHQFAEVNLTQLRLKNGMTVWLKPTDYEIDEIDIKLASMGGYAALPAEQRFSGEMAAEIAWESGMGGWTADQISVMLYENSLEFVPKIQAFSRTVEGTSSSEGIEAFLNITSMLFTKQQFTKEGMRLAETNVRNSLRKLEKDCDHVYEALFLKVNTQGLSVVKPMTIEDLKSVNFDVSREFFRRSFANPSEFVCVIVGSFDLEEVKGLVAKYLGSIPKTDISFNDKSQVAAPFPPGITQEEIQLRGRPDSVTRLTFPAKIALDEKSMHTMAFTCQVIEARLRRVITDQMKLSYGIDVSYEFPLYPRLDNPWISIRFRSDEKLIPELRNLIIHELGLMMENGVTDAEITEIKKLEAGSDEFWLHDNVYWASMLTNYYLWGWKPVSIYFGADKTQNLQASNVQQFLKNAISLTNYSVVSAKPSKE
jgi:zinc protease